MSISAETVALRVAVVRERISAAGGMGVRIVAVTKTFGFDAVQAAAAAGCDGIGENYANELVDKLAGHASPLPVHFIGQLQSNKVRVVAPYVAVYESVDRASLAVELSKRAPGAAVLVQVRPATDAGGKAGCVIDQVPALVDQCAVSACRRSG